MIDITEKKFKLPFFWLLVVMFLVTSSFLIFYSFGYTFDPQRGLFVHAGSVTIKSNPQNIDVELNGLNISKKLNRLNNSFHVDRIQPAEYILKIKAPGFSTWSKKINVHSGFSTEFWNVLLTKDFYERTSYPIENVSNFFMSPSKNLIAGTKNENEVFSVFILDIKNNTVNEILSSKEYSLTSDKLENIEWSPESQKLIIPLEKDSEKEYLSFDTESQQTTSISELSKLDSISNVRWDSEDKNVVYFISNKNLYRMDISNAENKQVLAETISSYDISGNFIYYFQLPGGIVFQIKADGSSKPLQITMSAPSEISDSTYKLIVYDKEKMVMRNDSGKLYVFNKSKKDEYFRKLSDNARGTQFSNDGKKLLFWDNREIYTYFLSDWETQPYRSENDLKSITRYSQQVDNVHWSNNYEHVIYSVNNQLKITELDSRDNQNTFDIISLSKSDSKIVSNFGDNSIYFIDNINESTPIIQSIKFPESTGILGF